MATIVEERNILRLWFTAWMVVAVFLFYFFHRAHNLLASLCLLAVKNMVKIDLVVQPTSHKTCST